MNLFSIYNKLNDLLKHLFKPIPVLLTFAVSAVEINDYLTPDPMERVLTQIEESQKALNELKVVEIPDTLQTDLVKEARVLQQKLIAYAKIINSCNAISSNDLLSLKWQVMRFKDVIEASKTASNSMVGFIEKLGYEHRAELDLAVMYTPNISCDDSGFDKALDGVTKKLSDAKKDKDRIEVLNEFIVSDGVREFIKNRNDFIRSAFEYLNVVQLSLVYDLDIDNLSHVTNGK